MGCEGNLLLDRSVGAKIVLVSPKGGEEYGSEMDRLGQMMEEYVDDLR